MHKILFIEDSLDTQKLVELHLKHLSITHAETLQKAQAQLLIGEFDLILLDVGLPDGDGLQFLNTLKQDPRNSSTPVILLTARNATAEKVTAFSLGAEDYVTKPFDPIELKARVDAKLRKREAARQAMPELHFGNLTLSMQKQKLIVKSPTHREISLSSIEYRLLSHFARNEQQVFSRAQLIEIIGKNEKDIQDRTIDSHISNLRRKLKSTGYTLRSVYGSGYQLVAERLEISS